MNEVQQIYLVKYAKFSLEKKKAVHLLRLSDTPMGIQPGQDSLPPMPPLLLRDKLSLVMRMIRGSKT